MPLPTPSKGEHHDDFIHRCIPAIHKEYDKPGQADAVCESQWERHMKHQNAAEPMPMPEPDEDHGTYMKRCQDGGGTEEACQMMWEQHHGGGMEPMPGMPGMSSRRATVRMVSADVAEMLLYDTVGEDGWFGGGISAKVFREQVKAVKAKTLNLRVNSPGGSVFDAAAMMKALDEFPGRVEVDIDGVAASAASYLIMASDVIRVGSNSLVMVHNPHGVTAGGADEMRRMADLLDKAKEQILDAYQRKSKAGRQQLADWMAAETWFTGAEAVAAGLADSVTAPVRVAALAQYARVMAKLGYKHVPPLPGPTPADDAAWAETRRRQQVAAKLLGRTVYNFTHNSTVADSEPQWSSVDKGALPMLAFADHGDGTHHSSFSFPHHFVQGGSNKDEGGVWSNGTLYLHKGGLAAAWSAAMGAHTGQKASQAVIDHLQSHRRALGLDKQD